MNSVIYGLVLVGGESRRMGRDKAMLSYDGKQTQIERTTELLNSVCAQTFISQRKEQSFPIPAGAKPLFDSLDDFKGPLCGILSAMSQHPEAHWLVLACDLPFLQIETLQKLIDTFQSEQPQLTAYQSTYDGLPEPLCAIYPSGSNAELNALSKEIGKFCPRKLLIMKKAKLVKQDNPHSLDNINTSEEFEQTTGKALGLNTLS